MLILTRRRGEAITVGEDVEITVIDITKGRVRIGVEAPSDVEVHRKEVVDRDPGDR